MRSSVFGKLLLAALVALVIPSASLAERPRANVFGTPVDIVHLDQAELNLPVVTSNIPAPAGQFNALSSRATATAKPPSGKAKAPARKAKVVKRTGKSGALRGIPTARTAGARLLSHGPAVVGEQRIWLALDNVLGQYYLKFFTLRAVGENVEVWVANNLNFPAGDCRNGVRTTITDAQVAYLVREFDQNIYPKESAAFSVPPDRAGTDEHITGIVGPGLTGPGLVHPEGEGDNIVVLVDNVRDENYYDTNNANGFSYIAGFFSSTLNFYFDRNIMTIDAFDWIHRTGANPPHEPVPGDLCASAPARPFLYEGVFAHEYQHLLMQYEDPDELNWVNEGLADWAQTLTGYVDPATPITEIGFDSHVQCFLGWLGTQTAANPNPRSTGGPENSLTVWEDQGDDEVLCDYGAAYTMMEFLAGRYGADFMTALHRLDANGLAGLQEALLAEGETKTSARDVLHDWAVMVAVDGLIDDGMRILGNFREGDFTTPTLDATINWNTPEAYSTPGAPPNGSDYVRLRDAAGNYLSGRDIESLSFQGAATLPPDPVAWTVDPNPPFHAGNPALYSGAANDRDEAIVREIIVGRNGGATLTFDALWNEEAGWDFGFVQVSTDGGVTYKSIACTDTTTQTNPEALPTAKENVPGFTGYSGGWRTQTCSLAAYAGQTVLLAFRAFNDPAALGETAAIPPGFWVDNVRVGGTLISDGSTLAGWRSFSQVRPTSVENFTVRIISIDTAKGKITVKELPLTGDFTIRGRANVQKYIDRNADFVGAIVTYDEPTETVTDYAPYSLMVNGVLQPGGGM